MSLVLFFGVTLFSFQVFLAQQSEGPNPASTHKEDNLRRTASRTLNSLGILYYEGNQVEKAVSAFEDALKYEPTNADIRINLALGYVQQGQFQKVIETLGSSNTPQADERSLTALAIAYFALKKYDQAVLYYEKLVEKMPGDVLLRLTLAVAYRFSGQSEKAESVLEQLPKEKMVQAQYHVILADAYRSQLVATEAVSEYTKALALSPDLPNVHYRLGVLYSDLNSYEKAVEAFRHELSINPQHAEATYSLGAYFLNYGNHIEKARQYFEKTLQLSPGHLGAYFSLMKIELSLGKPGAALELAQKAQATGRENEELYYLKSRALNLLGKKDEAERELRIFEELRAKKK